MKTTTSTMKATERGFNNMPDKAKIIRNLSRIGHITCVDVTDKSYWQNEEDTVVVEISQMHDTMTTVGNMLEAIKELQPDEAHHIKVDASTMIVRFWWD